MSEIKLNLFFMLSAVLFFSTSLYGNSARRLVEEGNQAYHRMDYDPAAELYSKALEADSKATEALFNKANALYRKGDLEGAADAWQQAAVQTRNRDLAARAKYNFGNARFGQGMDQKDKDPQQAIQRLGEGVDAWR
ncbi:MAG TPA: tetratricopeptide repeat protein, partial [Anaerohalosphaeraceae bacterium]|nr:tetratricopeptide repeat protein [Anaerohalosphaeraceae bacterium]